MPTYKTFDLTTLELSSGTHPLRVKARATGFKDSEFSNTVNYVAASKLATPTISIVNVRTYTYKDRYGRTQTAYYDDLSITQVENATSYELYCDDELVTTFQAQSPTSTPINVGDINQYVGSQTGVTYVFKLKAIANGYEGSDFSNTISYYVPCFAEDTKIRLADGTDKLVQDITYDDELLVWDFYEGKLNKAKPCWIKITQTTNHYSEITLDNGTVMRLVGPHGHRLFCIEKQKMIYSNKLVGFHVYTLNGIAKVLSYKNVQEHIKYYNLTTEKYLDCFADGVLTGSRLNNMYHISNMKYDSNERLISKEEEAERWEVRESLRK